MRVYTLYTSDQLLNLAHIGEKYEKEETKTKQTPVPA